MHGQRSRTWLRRKAERMRLPSVGQVSREAPSVTEPDFLQLGNQNKVRRIISAFASQETLAGFDAAAGDIVKRWYSLARDHLSAARHLLRVRGAWRSVVSRTYYAAYNASRAVRLHVTGSVKRGAKDHKSIADLPDDFPRRRDWSAFLQDLRFDRSLSDYEPWPETYRELNRRPAQSLREVTDFLRSVREYLGGRGVKL